MSQRKKYDTWPEDTLCYNLRLELQDSIACIGVSNDLPTEVSLDSPQDMFIDEEQPRPRILPSRPQQKFKKQREAVQAKFTKVLDKIHELYGKEGPERRKELETALQNTIDVVDGTLSVDEYLKYARKDVSGQDARNLRILGSVMVAAAVALGVLSGFLFAGTLGLGTAGAVTLAVGSVYFMGKAHTFFGQASRLDLANPMLAAGKALESFHKK